ncbi:MAG: cytochrome c3 family protein [Thermodesulfobacteriota bacterium]
MKKSVLLILITIVLILMPYEVRGGEYHNPATNTLACSDCHSIHGSQGGASMLFSPDTSTNLRLIRNNTIVSLCKYCHESNSLSMTNPTPPDVWNNSQNYIPSAGDFADRGTEDDTNRHNVGASGMKSTPPPGYQGGAIWDTVVDMYDGYSSDPIIMPPMADDVFTCLYCHSQHGNKNYRNLRYDPGNPANDNSTSPLAVKITYSLDSGGSCSDGVGTYPNCDIDNITTSGVGPDSSLYKYNRGNVKFRKAASDTNGIAPWCGKCHSDFHGAGGDSNVGGSALGDTSAWGDEWIRHPVRDVSLGEANTNLHADYANWSSALTNRTRHIDPNGTPGDSDDEPFCFACHYVHGGGNPGAGASDYNHTNLVKLDISGNLNLQGTGTPTDYLLRNICQQCHNQ